MLLQRWANIVFAVVMLGACAWFATMAMGFEAVGLLATSGVPSKFFPLFTLGFIALCAAAVIVTYALRGSAGGDAGATVFEDAGEARRGILMLFVAVSSYIVWLNFGFIAMGALMGPASLLAMGVRSPVIYAVVLALTALVYLIFTRLLAVQLV